MTKCAIWRLMLSCMVSAMFTWTITYRFIELNGSDITRVMIVVFLAKFFRRLYAFRRFLLSRATYSMQWCNVSLSLSSAKPKDQIWIQVNEGALRMYAWKRYRCSSICSINILVNVYRTWSISLNQQLGILYTNLQWFFPYRLIASPCEALLSNCINSEHRTMRKKKEMKKGI